MALLPPGHNPATAAELSAQRDLADFLRKPNGRGEFDGLSQWAASRPGVERSPFVVLVDQLEEVYTLCSHKDEREAFIGVLLHAAAARSRHVSIVLTLRSDFLGEMHRHHVELHRLIGAQEVIVTAMNRDELRQAITEPAAQAGQPIDDATVELLLDQAWGNEGTLPLLEFALTNIWEGMHAGQEPGETLRKMGVVGGALAGKAQAICNQLDPSKQATAQRALVRLVRLGEGTRDTRRRAPISELCGRGETEARVLGVLRKFATEQARLVTLSGDGAEPLAEVTHEALFDHWAALRTWSMWSAAGSWSLSAATPVKDCSGCIEPRRKAARMRHCLTCSRVQSTPQALPRPFSWATGAAWWARCIARMVSASSPRAGTRRRAYGTSRPKRAGPSSLRRSFAAICRRSSIPTTRTSSSPACPRPRTA